MGPAVHVEDVGVSRGGTLVGRGGECIVEDCARPPVAKRLCNLHYQRLRSTGSLLLRGIHASATGEATRQRILLAIDGYYQLNGSMPSTRELCRLIGLRSVSTVHKHLQRLVKAGLLRQVGTERRYVRVGACPTCGRSV